jgi:hypothetical protein
MARRRHEVRVTSWNQLQDELFRNAWQESIGRFRSTYAFRGTSRADASLDTGLATRRCAHLETHLLRNFRKYAQRTDVPRDSTWNWLALAQHHGLPTRLLDWTYSPFVALHFATAAVHDFDQDGVIWCIDFVTANKHLPPPLRRLLRDEGAMVFTAEMLDRVTRSLGSLDRLAKKEFVIFLEPPSLDDRIVNQFALFSLMPGPRASLDRWLRAHPELVRRLIIPASIKLEVRDKLDQANITERVLLPGLDGLCLWLTRQYAPMGARDGAPSPKSWKTRREGLGTL